MRCLHRMPPAIQIVPKLNESERVCEIAATRVLLLSTLDSPEHDTHWASPYYALKRAFELTAEGQASLTNDPREADIIIVCPRLKNPVFPIEIFTSTIIRKYSAKVVIFSTDDSPFMTHPGIYTSLTLANAHDSVFLGGLYPSVAFGERSTVVEVVDPQYLFSFVGDVDTHLVRGRMAHLASTDWGVQADQIGRKFYVVDSKSPSLKNMPTTVHDEVKYRHQYDEILANSQFILCPRGRCPSSIRLFEAMRAGRVPVIISDDWVPPESVPWSEFALFVKESDIDQIPSILHRESHSYGRRSQLAKVAWNNYFEAKVLPRTIVNWACVVLENARTPAGHRALAKVLRRQIRSWKFFRRGVVSTIRQSVLALVR